MTKSRILLAALGALALVALATLGLSWGFLFQARAHGVGKGFQAALVRTYQMGRPIPDGQYVVDDTYRIEASHEVSGAKTVMVRVRVMENRTGWKLSEASSSVNAY